MCMRVATGPLRTTSCHCWRPTTFKKDFSVLSLDIDGNDYWGAACDLSQFRPQLIVTEINEKIPPPIRFVQYNRTSVRHHFFAIRSRLLSDLCEERLIASSRLNTTTPSWRRKSSPAACCGSRGSLPCGYLERPTEERSSALILTWKQFIL